MNAIHSLLAKLYEAEIDFVVRDTVIYIADSEIEICECEDYRRFVYVDGSRILSVDETIDYINNN